MDKYVFLTSSARNVGGAQLYISRKMDWLKSIGWDVDMYFYNDGDIVIDNLKPFKSHCIPELAHPFELLGKRKKRKVLNKIKLEGYDKIIIESHLLNLCLWGEYIVSQKNGMNLCYLLCETFPKISDTMRDFLNYKLKQNLLYGISDRSIPSLLGDSEVSMKKGLVAAGSIVNNVIDEEFINVPLSLEGKINILSLGRLDKPYILPMVESIKQFISSHKELLFNVVFVGDAADTNLKKVIINSVKEESNADAFCTGFINPIPRILLKQMDVAIASAGCVVVTMNEGVLTISIDGEDNMAIGVCGITTNNTLYRTTEPKRKIEEFLEEILIEKKYNPEEIEYKTAYKTDKVDYSQHKEIIDRYDNSNTFDMVNWPLSIKQIVLKSLMILLGYKNYKRMIRFIS